ncbi:MAG: aminoacyl-tRNA hydrolase [Candidatus Komeilibacteria bacterium]|nr:aminoacyl-tRNA hydrolase [Candidatus Komeilibacteria bacterium]
MKLIVGLGNPGKEYEKTRHNTGWLVLDSLVRQEQWAENKKAKLLYLKTQLNEMAVELIKPLTFMNNSGEAAAYAAKNHQAKPEDIFVVYDDLDLPLGKIRIGQFESAGGHNGIKSIIEHLKTKKFIRVRIGIGNGNSAKQPAEKFVLQKFGLTEKNKIKEAINTAAEAIKMLMAEPLEKVMNKYN